MKKLIALVFGVFTVCVLFSCATAYGKSLVTGAVREAISDEEVVIYTEAPAKYDVIGIVSASSDATGDAQTDLNYAVKELKKQAAKIGANGIILDSLSSSNSGGVFVANVFVAISTQNVSGKAIYVEK